MKRILKIIIIYILFFNLLSFSTFPQDHFLQKKIAYLKNDLKEKERKIKNLEEKYAHLEKIVEKELESAYMKIKYLKERISEKERIIEEKEKKIKELESLLKKANNSLENLLKKANAKF